MTEKTWTGPEFEIEFYERRAKWLRDRVGPDPATLWEFFPVRVGKWVPNGCNIPTFDGHMYRWKPAKKRTVNIGGVELVAPEREAPEFGTTVWIMTITESVRHTLGDASWRLYREAGAMFLTREDAEAMRIAQMKQRA